MSLQQGLYALINSAPEITGLLGIVGGSPPFFSVYHGDLRKGYILPAIKFSVVSSTPLVANTGTANQNYERIQFDCIAAQYLDATSLKDALKALLIDYVGTLAEGTTVYSSILRMELDSPLEEGKGGYLFRSVLDIEFGYDSLGTDVLIPIPHVLLDIDDVGLPQFNSGN